jgi:outer membrane murein-binding lipoprotein Lpp
MEEDMRKIVAAGSALVALSALSLGGCATKSDIDSLHQEIAGLRSSIESIDAKASRAQADAAKAASDAQMAAQNAQTASDKADRIYREGLRK